MELLNVDEALADVEMEVVKVLLLYAVGRRLLLMSDVDAISDEGARPEVDATDATELSELCNAPPPVTAPVTPLDAGEVLLPRPLGATVVSKVSVVVPDDDLCPADGAALP